jgi:uncharacterized protein (DUF697 family)
LEANGFDYEEEFDYENQFGYQQEFDHESDDEMDDEYDYEYGSGSPFSEEEEAELAFELLSVGSDQELDEFLGSLIKKARRGLKKIGSSGIFKTLGKGLKSIAKKALPVAGGAIGAFFGGPAGTALGSKLGSVASNLFEIELEGLSPEDQEFEVAKRVVRFSGNAARNALKLSDKMSPQQAVTLAFKNAAKKHAPGLLQKVPAMATASPAPSMSGTKPRASGRWMRKGNKIILFGM